ncbi:MAG: phosphatase PAP2 family protein [Bacteroidia bacterium]|nr:phosphatase PAP2 family protein [Bacteroidia bacterium]
MSQLEQYPSARFYVFTYLLFWLVGGLLLLYYGYEESFRVVNQWHTPLGDKIMPHLTHLGHGMLVGSLFLIVGRKSRPQILLAMLLSMIGIAVVSAVGKNIFFEDWGRPAKVLGSANIHFISLIGEKNQSFPSGHSAVAAAVFFFITLSLEKKSVWLSVGFALLSIIACYSRVYIGVHFPADILAGSMLGLLLSVGMVKLITYYFPRRVFDFFRNADRSANGFAGLGFVLLAIDVYVIVTQNYL